jgi:hypothetical protein
MSDISHGGFRFECRVSDLHFRLLISFGELVQQQCHRQATPTCLPRNRLLNMPYVGYNVAFLTAHSVTDDFTSFLLEYAYVIRL